MPFSYNHPNQYSNHTSEIYSLSGQRTNISTGISAMRPASQPCSVEPGKLSRQCSPVGAINRPGRPINPGKPVKHTVLHLTQPIKVGKHPDYNSNH